MIKDLSASELRIYSPIFRLQFRTIAIVLILMPVVFLGWLVDRYGVDVPYFDEWNWINFFEATKANKLTLQDLWWQHNEHRLFFLKLLTLSLAQNDGWNIIRECFVSIFFVFLTLLLFWQLLRKTISEKYALYLTIPVSFTLFSTIQWFNWLWGFQMAWFLVNLLIVCAVWLLHIYRGRWYGFLLAALATTVACYTMSNAIPYWVAGFIPFLFQTGWAKYYRFLWLLCGMACIFFFYYNFELTSQSDYTFILKQPLTAIFYILTFLGAPLLSTFGWVGASIIGSLGLLTACITTYEIYRLSKKAHNKFLFEKTFPWLQLIAWVLGNALLSCIARGSSGINSALVPRYVTVPGIFWIGVFALVSLLGSTVYKNSNSKLSRCTLLVCALLVGAIWTGNYIYQQNVYSKVMESWWESLSRTAIFILDYKNSPAEGMEFVHPNIGLIQSGSIFLEANNHTLFSTSGRARLQKTAEIWLSKISDPSRKIYSSKEVVSSVSLSKFAPSDSGFNISFSENLLATFDTNLNSDLTKTATYLDISAEQVRYLNLYMDYGQGFTEKLIVPSLAFAGKPNQFVTRLNPNIQKLRVELIYKEPNVRNAPVQLNLYKE